MSDLLLAHDRINYGTTQKRPIVVSSTASRIAAEEHENDEEITTVMTELKYFLKAMVLNRPS